MILGYESICWCFIDYLTAVKDTRLKRQGLKEIYNFVIFHKKENISKNEGPVSDLFMKIDSLIAFPLPSMIQLMSSYFL